MDQSPNSNSFSSILLIVAFLVLTAIVTILYGGSEEQKAKMEQNFFYQKVRLVLDTVWTAAQGIVAINLNKNTGWSPVTKEINNLSTVAFDSSAASSSPAASEPGFWSNLATKIKDEWNNTNTADNNGYGVNDLNSNNGNATNFLDWQKTATGAELIFRGKSGQEYKLSLPFKFLSQ